MAPPIPCQMVGISPRSGMASKVVTIGCRTTVGATTEAGRYPECVGKGHITNQL